LIKELPLPGRANWKKALRFFNSVKAAEHDQAANNQEEDDSDEIDPDMDGRYRIEMAEVGVAEGGPGKQEP
jgi:hypothetical protein